MSVAEEAQELFERKVSWGIQAGEDTYLFTHVTAPAMTRLRIAERRVLDTLLNAGVANSHSEALSWCVSFVSKTRRPGCPICVMRSRLSKKCGATDRKGKNPSRIANCGTTAGDAPRPLILVSVDLRRDGSRNSLPLW